MPRTQTKPPDDPKLWRRLIARTHPDAGGDGELFIWTTALKDLVCGGELRVEPKPPPRSPGPRREPPAPPHDPDRIPFVPTVGDFSELTDLAVGVADEVAPVFADVLRLLADCYTAEDEPLRGQQNRGATYKQLAAIAHKRGMSKGERTAWYRLAESIPLAQRHAGHLLGRLQDKAA